MRYDQFYSNLIVHVKDSGVGIERQNIEGLFNRIGQHERTASENNARIGFGLTVVKNIVEKAGGKVAALSEGLGKGCTFCFSMNMPSFDSEQDAE